MQFCKRAIFHFLIDYKISGNSTFLGSFSFGEGIEFLKLNAWKAEVDGMGVIFSTTPRNCIPVSEAVAGKFRKGRLSSSTVLCTH